MQHSLSPLVLGTLPVGILREVELGAGPDPLFLDTLRANLHAAARHTVLGHTGPSFRECTGPACVEAAKLLPELDPVEAATDAELDAILDQVLDRLEREGEFFLTPKPS
ncbi:MAG TPA: hypothetical protein VNM67_05055 [Thermoanaerobaculia bacterium]|jgi:hypothetical protein|nr:hypothetical protein [Thermoanaerobaculia bacterium]